MSDLKTIDQALGGEVRRRREVAGLRQVDLANLVAEYTALPWTRNTVTAIERGTRSCSLGELFALAAVFGCGVYELLSGALVDHEGTGTQKFDLGAGRWLSNFVAANLLSSQVAIPYPDGYDPDVRPGEIDTVSFAEAGLRAKADPTLAAVAQSMERAGMGVQVDEAVAAAAFQAWRLDQESPWREAATTEQAIVLLEGHSKSLPGLAAETKGKDPARVARAVRIRMVQALAMQLLAYVNKGEAK